jgi:hypothetical protein
MYKLNIKIIPEGMGSISKFNDDGSTICIPTDPANTDYQAYLKWLEAGNTPEEAE